MILKLLNHNESSPPHPVLISATVCHSASIQTLQVKEEPGNTSLNPRIIPHHFRQSLRSRHPTHTTILKSYSRSPLAILVPGSVGHGLATVIVITDVVDVHPIGCSELRLR